MAIKATRFPSPDRELSPTRVTEFDMSDRPDSVIKGRTQALNCISGNQENIDVRLIDLDAIALDAIANVDLQDSPLFLRTTPSKTAQSGVSLGET
jgi:hypothetical protein